MLSALVTGVVVVVLAALDAHAILEGIPQVAAHCKLKLLLGGAAFLVLGLVGYGLAAATQYATQLKLFSSAPPSWAPILGGVVLVQALRLDYFRPTDVSGIQHAAADRESAYRKCLRIWLNDIYRGLVDRVPEGDPARRLIRRGLAAAYSYPEIAAEFRTWADGRPDVDLLNNWLDHVQKSKLSGPDNKIEMLVRRILIEDLPTGRELATRRAAAIVQLKAF